MAIPALGYTGALGVAQVTCAVPMPLPPEQAVVDADGPCLPKLHSMLSKPGDLDSSRGGGVAATILDSGISITITAAVASAERPPSEVTVTVASMGWSETLSSTLAGRFPA